MYRQKTYGAILFWGKKEYSFPKYLWEFDTYVYLHLPGDKCISSKKGMTCQEIKELQNDLIRVYSGLL